MNLHRQFFSIFVAILCSSCNVLFDAKDSGLFTKCDGSNCYDITIGGSITDKSNQKVRQDIPVTLTWMNPVFAESTESVIDVQHCDLQGAFAFANSIDTTNFNKGYFLKISIPQNANYLAYPKGNAYSAYSTRDLNALKSLPYEVFTRTTLQIVLVREKNDALESMSVCHYFRKDMGYTDRTITKTGNTFNYPLNATLSVETAAGIKTYISWTKKVYGTTTTYNDSIICSANRSNYYQLKY